MEIEAAANLSVVRAQVGDTFPWQGTHPSEDGRG